MSPEDIESAIAAGKPTGKSGPLTDDQLRARVALSREYNQKEASRLLGISVSTMNGSMRRASQRGLDGSVPIRVPDGYIVKENTVSLDGEGDVRAQTVKTARDVGDDFHVISDHFVKGESAFLDADGKIIAKWVKTAKGAKDLNRLVGSLRDSFGDVPRAPAVELRADVDEDLLNILPIADLHLGMYAWAEETGSDYDVEIAGRLFRDVYGRLISMAPPAKEMVILGLGDFTHANGSKAMTPGSGNMLDVDTRFEKVILVAVSLMKWIVDEALKSHETVRVRNLKGNHDPESAIALSVALAAHYENDPRVVVDLSPAMVWFHRWGEVGLGGFHGHTFKPDRIFALMADWFRRTRQVPAMWTRSYHGHIHHETSKSDGHNKVESIQTITATDAWHAGAGYVSERASKIITHHKNQPDYLVQTVSLRHGGVD